MLNLHFSFIERNRLLELLGTDCLYVFYATVQKLYSIFFWGKTCKATYNIEKPPQWYNGKRERLKCGSFWARFQTGSNQRFKIRTCWLNTQHYGQRTTTGLLAVKNMCPSRVTYIYSKIGIQWNLCNPAP